MFFGSALVKAVRITLKKLSPGVDFINMLMCKLLLRQPFLYAVCQKCELKSTGGRASHKKLMKLTPEPNLIKRLGAYLGA